MVCDGTLSGREAERVERALAGDRELRMRYDLIRRELVETTRLNEPLGAPSARAMDKLFAAINAEQTRARCPRPISGSLSSSTSYSRMSTGRFAEVRNQIALN